MADDNLSLRDRIIIAVIQGAHSTPHVWPDADALANYAVEIANATARAVRASADGADGQDGGQ